MNSGGAASLRTFIALFPPLDVSKALCEEANQILEGSGSKLVTPGRLHLTLCFVGPIDPPDQERLGVELERRMGSMEPRVLGFGMGGVFGGRGRGEVLWVGPSKSSGGALRELRDASLDAIRRGGVVPAEGSRGWNPHMTIGRSRRRLPDGTRSLLESHSFLQSRQWAVAEVLVALSGPGIEGPYPEICRVALGG